MNKNDWKRLALLFLITDYTISTLANVHNRRLLALKRERISDLEDQVNYYIGKLEDAEVPLSEFDRIVVNHFNHINGHSD